MNIQRDRAFVSSIVLVFASALYFSCELLPVRVAANFGRGDVVVTFNSRDSYQILMSIIAIELPFAIYVFTQLFIRFIWLPHRDYWLAPERYISTGLWIERFSLVTAALVSLFWLALHAVNFRATILDPPHYELWPRLTLLMGWLIFVGMSGYLYRERFYRVP